MLLSFFSYESESIETLDCINYGGGGSSEHLFWALYAVVVSHDFVELTQGLRVDAETLTGMS